MIIRRETINAVLPAVEDDNQGRPALTGVHIEPEQNRIISTNGFVLLIATDTEPHADPDFPIVPGAPFNGNPKPITIPADTIRRVLKAIPKRATIPILQGVQVSANGSEDTATIAATDLQVPAIATVKRDDLPGFPSYDRVLPKADRDELTVILGSNILKTLIKAAEAIHGNKTPAAITFGFPTNKADATIRISFKGSGVEVSGAAMPIRS
jgi:hypothetical protein